MKHYDWNDSKNDLLKQARNISFEEVVLAIESGDLLDRVRHPDQKKYPHQMVLYVKMNDYVYAVPCVENDDKVFLKTIIPDRKATKKYLGGNNGQG